MTSSDPLLSRLAELDPARDVGVGRDRADTLLARINADISSAGSGPGPEPVRFAVGQLFNWMPAALVAAVCVGVVLLVTQVHARAPGSIPATERSHAAPASGQAQLLNLLGVLRRPQTASDRKVFAQSGLAGEPRGFFGHVDAASARVATVTAWGSRVLVALTDIDHHERLILWHDHGGGAGGTVALIQAGEDVSTEGWGADYAGGASGARVYVVVPDGVTRVTAVLPQSAAISGSGPSYARPLRITVKVRGNVAAFEARRSCCERALAMIWYASNGRVIKQIGHVSATRPTTHPVPTPATAASRAAQRDPATANLVRVIPRVGGLRTSFQISWRLLLTGAVYEFTPVGPHGVNCAGASGLPGGLSGGTTNVRGQSYGERLRPPSGRDWCPGTYRVAVNVLALGPGRPALSPAPQPFGSASFTVRR